MPAITEFLHRVVPQDSSSNQGMLTLGFPLETESTTIYPVFQTSRADVATDRTIRQIGYLEIGDNRSDYVSLEPRKRAPFLLLGLAILALLTGELVRRLRH